jgi:tRNA pseudouridine65 synthase
MTLLYTDANVVVVDKPSGLLVHRSALASDRVTVLSLLRDQFGRYVWPVHRLDRGASGVLLFALSPGDAGALIEQFRARSVQKRYWCVVRGWLGDEIEVDYPLVEEDGGDGTPQTAVTRFRQLAAIELPVAVSRYPTTRYSLVEANPSTGRRHQIRRHLAHLRHPVIGDTVHGDGRHNRFFRERFGVARLLLHASSLAFHHPASGEPLEIRSWDFVVPGLDLSPPGQFSSGH